jgi:Holliday junction resolvasome RuvABC endonuclease subunit
MLKLGVDQSLNGTAWVVIDQAGVLINFGVIRSDKAASDFSRASSIAYAIRDVYTAYKPSQIAVEGLAFGAPGNATRQLAGLQFTIAHVLEYQCNSPPIQVIAPTSVKKRATGKGNSKKQEVHDALPEPVRNAFATAGYRKTTGAFDLSDAYWIASSLS